MQTLPTGSFLRLENSSAVESLKFTARLLAEHTEKVVKEHLTAAALENLANNLWQKAEYVTLEVERRRLHEIFVENFTERFRELKPDFDALTNEIAGLLNQSAAPEKIEEVNSDQPIPQSNTSPPTQAPEVEAVQKDEFLGLVKSDESLNETTARETAEAIRAPEEIEQATVQTEAVKTEKESGMAEMSVSEDEIFSQKTETIEENKEPEKAPTIAHQNNSRPVAQAKSEATVTSAAKEPFEFGKCKISLNLTLFPSFSGAASRKVIISTASHDLQPEIEYLEISEGENIEQITALIKDKLTRFRGTLPVKYIEQLRASKTKSVKTSQNPKSTLSPGNTQTTGEKTSGEQAANVTANQASDVIVQSSTTSEPASVVAPNIAANDRIQPNLF